MSLSASEGVPALKKQAAAIFLLTILHSAAFAQRAAVAPYRHPLKHPVSASEAQKEYEELLRKVKAAGPPAATNSPDSASTPEPVDCPGLDGSIRRCVSGEGLLYYVGEYLPYASNAPAFVPDSSVSSSLGGGAAEPGWAPAEKVVGGGALLESLEGSLAKKWLEGCEDDPGECRAVVEAVPARKGERVLAVCDVARVGEETGSGRNCVPVAVVTPGASYLRSVVGYTPGAGGAAKPDEWDTVVVYRLTRDSEDATLPDLKTVLDTVRGALESGLVKLKAGLSPKEEPVRVFGVAGARVSPLSRLERSGVWEKVSVVVDGSREGGGLALTISFSMVMRGSHPPNAQPEDFRPPSLNEVKLYEDGIDASIRLPIARLCGATGRWRGPTTFVCGSSPSN